MKPIVSAPAPLVARRDLKNDYLSLTFGPFPRSRQVKPGQFAHIHIPQAPVYYRRAFSIAGVDRETKSLEIILKVVGRGSRALASLRTGDQVDFLAPLGKPFSPPRSGQTVIMVAGGVGYPPLLFLATHLVERGVDPNRIYFLYGGRSGPDIIDRSRIKKLGVRFVPTTQDGSFGEKGLVTAPLTRLLADESIKKPMIYSCGPEGLLKAVDHLASEFETPGELALEAPMPCGFGICLGCVVPLRAGGFARVCQEGPVFSVGETIL